MYVDLQIPSVKKFSLWSNWMEYKRNEVSTTIKLKYESIEISRLKYFKMQIIWRVSNFLSQQEFQFVCTK